MLYGVCTQALYSLSRTSSLGLLFHNNPPEKNNRENHIDFFSVT